jgi:hypothetical protein
MISRIRIRRPRIETVRRRIDDWRRRRPHARAPLPPGVWAAAVELVSEHGLYGTARALGVSYGALKRHVERDGWDRSHPRARFVELSPVPVADGYLIEIDSGAGLTLRVRLNGLALSEVADFTRRVVGAVS